MADPASTPISDYIRAPYVTVEAGDATRIAYRRMEGDNMRSLVVVKDKQYVGIVDWQSIHHLSSDELSEPVEKYARQDVPTLTAETTISDAMEAFHATDVVAVGLLPVLNADGVLEGMIDRDEFQGLMEDASGKITVPEDSMAHLLSGPDSPKTGAKVVTSDGHKIGEFQRFVEDRGRARWIAVQHGHAWRKRDRYVPLVAVDHHSRDEITLNVDEATWETFSDEPGEE